jgi:pyrroloquinoline-quinone synthase
VIDPAVREAFVERLRREGEHRYHHQHPFNLRMHDGRLSKEELQRWVLNRYYYQTRIPIKDALIVTKSEDPAFRRMWIHRIIDHDGTQAGDGGLALWLRLAEGVGLDAAQVESCSGVLPSVRSACDSYVNFVRGARLEEAVASSLTELFAPDLMNQRIAAWERHYPWVDRDALEYFRTRVKRGRDDSAEAIDWLVSLPDFSAPTQERCVAALIFKTNVLRRLLDGVEAAR